MFLDSLDEVVKNKRAGCVDAIRDFVDRFGTPGVAVCKRIQKYEVLANRLKLGGSITLQPLRSVQVHDDLKHIGDRLKELCTGSENDKSLIKNGSAQTFCSTSSCSEPSPP
jgi:hypothetical protein